MGKNFLTLNPKRENERIVSFIKTTLKEQKFSKAVIGVSGGIDSTTSLYLLAKSIAPKNIYPVHLPYFSTATHATEKLIAELEIPKKNFRVISIKPFIDVFQKKVLNFEHSNLEFVSDLEFRISDLREIRLGNLMARIRMIILYDLAKKHNALVCGTENKSEHLLGYFTRFGDQASDFEPIRHLYKTQICQMAKYLGVSQEIIKQQPTAGLWSGQTDEREFGFTYEEADQVLYLYFDKKQSIAKIEKFGFKNTRKIIDFADKNSFKQQVPYSMT